MKKSKAPLKSTQIQRTVAPAPAVAPRPAAPRPQPAGPAAPVQRVGCACGGEIGTDGQCADCRGREERVQRKMAVNPPGDALEQEADRVVRAHVQRQAAKQEEPVQRQTADKEALPVQRREADKDMPTQRQAAEPETPVQHKAADEETMPAQRRAADEDAALVQRQATEPEKPVQRKAADEETKSPQRRAADEDAGAPVQRAGGASVPEVTPAVESGIQGARGGGSALPPAVQRSMEDTMGADLSGVRVHHDGRADQLSRQLDARAFTSGQDIFFRGGEYNPESGQGRELLAHEAAHTVQQGGGASRSMTQNSAGRAGAPIQRSEQDPDELAAMSKEDESIKERAKQAIASGRPGIAVSEVLWRLINSHRLNMHLELEGTRYDKTRKGVHVELSGKGVKTTGMIVAGDDILQRVAGGQTAQVAKEIATQIAKVGSARGTIDYVFIMGADAPRSGNKFYTEAKKFFRAEHPGAVMIDDVRNLEGINQRVNVENKPVANLHIVSHAHPDGTLQFSINPSDKTPGQVQYSELKEANEKQTLTKPKPELVGPWTNVMIRGCNLGRSEEMLLEAQKAFGGEARVIAPTHAQRYGSGKESLAGPFYEEPGISKLTDNQAFERIKAKPEYAFITNWAAMRDKLRRVNQSIPEIVYEAQFPTNGQEIAFLKAAKDAKMVRNYTVGPSRVEGVNTIFSYIPKDPTKLGPVELSIETPPTDNAAIQSARNTVAGPDAYAYKVRRTRSGLTLSVIVDIQRTIWELHHAEIRKQGKGFNPSPGTKPWFGDTQ